jgi:putative (di)nucleoside polyphosphate hydrolase
MVPRRQNGSLRSGGKPSRKTSRNKPSSDHNGVATARVAPAELIEPDLVVLLGEPEVRLMMLADNVQEDELRELLASVSLQLRSGDDRSKSAAGVAPIANAGFDDSFYRAGVGVVLINRRGEVFVGRRADVIEDAWQMPQGGINRGESPRAAALRELKEEIGTNAVEIVGESEQWLYYDVPEALARKAWGGRWRGQRQKWFVMLFNGKDADINVATAQPEFNAWRWVPLADLEALSVSFKRQLYLNVLGQFPEIFRD